MSTKSTASKLTKGPINVKVTHASKKKENGLQEQYEVIRDDFQKLKKDLTTGYDMAKEQVEKSGFFRQFMKSK
jgi:hypothetical protein